MNHKENSVPEWIIKYDKNNYQSSAGKAIRELLKMLDNKPSGFALNVAQVKDKIQAIKNDERLYYPTATVFENAPLALIQLQMGTELNTLERIVGLEPSKFPLKK